MLPFHDGPVALCERDGSDTEADLLASLFETMHREAASVADRDRLMARPMAQAILRHASFAEALADRLAVRLADADISRETLRDLIEQILADSPTALHSAVTDLRAVRDRDPACPDLVTPFLNFKGFQSLQAYRVGHAVWRRGRQHLARHIQSRTSEVFGVDIHPAARLGCGIMIDHGTGVVIGETAVVENDVSILQSVTLGGTGKECGDRHPKIRRGVLLGAGAKVLGNIEVAEGAKVGAGSIVLTDVPPYTTVVGVPARPVGAKLTGLPALTMDQSLPAPEYVI